VQYSVHYVGWIGSHAKQFDQWVGVNVSAVKPTHVYQTLWPINYGKYKIFNHMIDTIRSDPLYDLVIYMDHDIHFDFNTIDMFEHLIAIPEEIPDGSPDRVSVSVPVSVSVSVPVSVSVSVSVGVPDATQSRPLIRLGMIGLNQSGDNRHSPDIMAHTSAYGQLQLCWPSHIGAIASGGFMMFPSVLGAMRHFDLVDVYGLDDYWFDKQLAESNHRNLVVGNVYVVHDHDTNTRYGAWKKNKVLRLIGSMGSIELMGSMVDSSADSMAVGGSSEYYNRVQESMNFWVV